MKLQLYIARKFLLALAMVLGVFVVFTMLLDMVEQIRRFGSDTISLSQALGLAALNTPANIYEILPLIVLLATLVLYMSLARTSELVVTRAAGRSAVRSLLSPLVSVLLVGTICVGVLNPLVAATSKELETLSNRYSRGISSVLSINADGLWLRQGDEDGQTVIKAARSNLDGTVLFDVTFIGFAADQGPTYRIEATRAELTDGAWDLTDAKRWDLSAPVQNPERTAEVSATLSVPSDLTRDHIRDSFGAPASIPFWDLPAFIDSLERAGFSARHHRVWWHMELALPAFFAAMVLIAAGFTMRHTRFGKTGTMVMAALGVGLSLFFLRNFAQILGNNGQIPAELAAWSPPLIGIMMSLGLVLHLEDG
ncbi:MAG: LPS export ABC transporter permease LptG [Rhodovulum sp.]|nr:LPS export ABC transporter permease LptG [Rhodovulum sp.]